MERPRRNRAGQALIIFALAFTALFGLLVFTIDGAMLYLDRRQVQNAADAGALAGAYALSKAPIPTYTPGHQAALDVVADDLPGTTAPTSASITNTGAATTYNIGNGYKVTVSAQVAGSGWDWYKVRVEHNHSLAFAPAIGFAPTMPVIAVAQAQSGTYPFALILLQNDIAQYDNLTMQGTNSQLTLMRAAGVTGQGGGFSNESMDTVQGKLTFSPCGNAGDLWANNEKLGSGTLLTNVTGQQGDLLCPTGNPTAPYPLATAQLPFPSYPEPAVTGPTYSGGAISVSSGTYFMCPGTYSSFTNTGATVYMMPGVYRFTGTINLNGAAGVVGTAQSYTPWPAAGTFFNCSGTQNAPADGDYGVIIEIAPSTCNQPAATTGAQFYISGNGASLNIIPSPKYHKISLYVELYGGSGWKTTCPYSGTTVPAGTHVLWFAGKGLYLVKGAIYSPADNVLLAGNGAGSGVGQLICWTLIVGGNGNVNESYDPTYLPYFRGLIQ